MREPAAWGLPVGRPSLRHLHEETMPYSEVHGVVRSGVHRVSFKGSFKGFYRAFRVYRVHGEL